MSLEPRLSIFEQKLRNAESAWREEDRLVKLLQQYVREASAFPLGSFGSSCIISITFHLTSSHGGGVAAGVTVDLLNSGAFVVASGVTNGSGDVTLQTFSADVLSYNAYGTNWVTRSASLGFNSCNITYTQNVTIKPGVFNAFCGKNVPFYQGLFDGSRTVNMSWDAVNTVWSGCALYVSAPGGGSCPSGMDVALFYSVDASYNLKLQYLSSGGCPSASTCASTPNTTAVWGGGSSSTLAPSSTNCSTFATAWVGTNTSLTWPGYVSQAISMSG